MFVERRINASTGAIDLWWCEWEKGEMAGAKKIYVNKIADEADVVGVKLDSFTEEPAICWSYGRTLGNIAVFSPMILGSFPVSPWSTSVAVSYTSNTLGNEDAKFGEMRCAFHDQRLNYVVGPPVINLDEADEVGIWCSMPAAISTEIPNRPSKIHVHVQPKAGGPKSVDRDYQLNHIGPSWDAVNHVPAGPAIIKQYVTLDKGGNSYSGTFAISQLGTDGKTLALPAPIKGLIVATRVTVNTDTQEP